MIDWSLFRWAKGISAGVQRRRHQGRQARALAACYAEVDARDGGICRFPGCYRPATARHHLVFRSKSRSGRSDPHNVIAICTEHHAWVHDHGWVEVCGDAADAVTWRVTALGREAGRVLPYTVTTPFSHLQPVRFLGHGERDPSRLSRSTPLRADERIPMAGPLPRP